MITGSITGTLPEFPYDISPLMQKIKDEVLMRTILGNFAVGGRPNTWQAKKDGWPSFLKKSTLLVDSIKGESGHNWARAGVSKADCVYALIHNFGGVITNGFGKGVLIRMPKREFVKWQEYDIETIKKMIPEYFIKFTKTKRIPQ